MAAPFGKRALALGGGGFTGYLFEIGALTALDDLLEDGVTMNDLDLYVGVSAGAAAASLMANGVKPQEILETNLSGTRPYYFDHRNVFSPAIGEGLKTVWRMIRQLVPLVKLYVRHSREMTFIDLLDKAQDALPSGIYSLEPFAAYLAAIFKTRGLSDTFAGLVKELYIPAIDLETGDGVCSARRVGETSPFPARSRLLPLCPFISARCASRAATTSMPASAGWPSSTWLSISTWIS